MRVTLAAVSGRTIKPLQITWRGQCRRRNGVQAERRSGAFSPPRSAQERRSELPRHSCGRCAVRLHPWWSSRFSNGRHASTTGMIPVAVASAGNTYDRNWIAILRSYSRNPRSSRTAALTIICPALATTISISGLTSRRRRVAHRIVVPFVITSSTRRT